MGKKMKFGKYPQFSLNSLVPIEWEILSIEGNKALLVSRLALDYQPFDTEGNNNWENSSLRKWLNNDFYDDAFSSEEKKRIVSTTVLNEALSFSYSETGQSTKDKIFLLSINELEKYYELDDFKKCRSTYYADNGKYWYYGSRYYWSRTAGSELNRVKVVSSYGDGYVMDYDHNANENNFVRPALWLYL